MTTKSATLPRQLAKGEILRLPRAAGSAVACLQGSIWVTEDADPLDHVLEPGQCLRLHGPGTTLVMALAPARLRVTPGSAKPEHRAGAATRLFERLAMDWSRPLLAIGRWA